MRPSPYTTNIPLARKRLRRIAEDLSGEGYHQYADAIVDITQTLMTRRPGPRRAPVSRSSVSGDIYRSVAQDLLWTTRPQEEIARRHNIDGGRVSEIYRKLLLRRELRTAARDVAPPGTDPANR